MGGLLSIAQCPNVLQLRGRFVPARDVGQGVGSQRKSPSLPEWALPVLGRMVERGILETGSAGQYRIKPNPKKAGEKCVPPQLASILKASGKKFAGLALDDACYESL